MAIFKALINSIHYLHYFRKRFEEICNKDVTIPGLLVMRDVAIAKSEFKPGEKAVTKIQDFVHDEVLFEYCGLPEVCIKDLYILF